MLNDIRITLYLAPDDIADQIEAALRRHAEREASHISVKAHAGDVTLEGFVGSLAERRAAVGAAWSAPGVIQVINTAHSLAVHNGAGSSTLRQSASIRIAGCSPAKAAA